jgi:hypothetical protein
MVDKLIVGCVVGGIIENYECIEERYGSYEENFRYAQAHFVT